MNSLFLIVHEHHLMTVSWYILLPIIIYLLISNFLQTEKAMATHSSTLAWKIPWVEEPGRLQSMGLLRVRHDWVTSLLRFTFMHWRRKWQPTPVFLPGESQGQRSLVGCCLCGCRVRYDWSDLAAAAGLVKGWPLSPWSCFIRYASDGMNTCPSIGT